MALVWYFVVILSLSFGVFVIVITWLLTSALVKYVVRRVGSAPVQSTRFLLRADKGFPSGPRKKICHFEWCSSAGEVTNSQEEKKFWEVLVGMCVESFETDGAQVSTSRRWDWDEMDGVVAGRGQHISLLGRGCSWKNRFQKWSQSVCQLHTEFFANTVHCQSAAHNFVNYD